MYPAVAICMDVNKFQNIIRDAVDVVGVHRLLCSELLADRTPLDVGSLILEALVFLAKRVLVCHG